MRLIDYFIESGSSWYREANTRLVELAQSKGIPLDRLCGILSVLSPRVSVLRNVRLASDYLCFGIRPNIVPSVLIALDKFETTGKIFGLKTRAFAANLSGDYSPVTLDSHMVKILGGKIGTPIQYSIQAWRVICLARYLKIAPADCQAGLWYGSIRSQNRNPVSFVDALADFGSKRFY